MTKIAIMRSPIQTHEFLETSFEPKKLFSGLAERLLTGSFADSQIENGECSRLGENDFSGIELCSTFSKLSIH
jgi:hypothetical protein